MATQIGQKQQTDMEEQLQQAQALQRTSEIESADNAKIINARRQPLPGELPESDHPICAGGICKARQKKLCDTFEVC